MTTREPAEPRRGSSEWIRLIRWVLDSWPRVLRVVVLIAAPIVGVLICVGIAATVIFYLKVVPQRWGIAAGLGGVRYGLYFSKTSYVLGFIPGLKGLTAAILGGIGTLPGAVRGGLLLGIMENVGAICLPAQLKDVGGFVAQLLVLIFRPTGILGARVARRT